MVPFPVNVASGISTHIFRHNLLIPKKCSDQFASEHFFLVRLAAHVSNGLKSRIRPVVGRI